MKYWTSVKNIKDSEKIKTRFANDVAPLLEMLPEEFTESDVVDVRISIGKDGKAKQMIANWLYRRLISVSDGGFRKVK